MYHVEPYTLPNYQPSSPNLVSHNTEGLVHYGNGNQEGLYVHHHLGQHITALSDSSITLLHDVLIPTTPVLAQTPSSTCAETTELTYLRHHSNFVFPLQYYLLPTHNAAPLLQELQNVGQTTPSARYAILALAATHVHLLRRQALGFVSNDETLAHWGQFWGKTRQALLDKRGFYTEGDAVAALQGLSYCLPLSLHGSTRLTFYNA